MRILKPSRDTMQRIGKLEVPGIDSRIRDTMAIPSFLHPNPLIRRIVWQRYQRIAELADFNAGETVLEFGCGAGFFLPEISRHCCRVIAVDLYPHFARELAALEELSIETTDTLQGIPDGSVNTIIAAEVMEHLDSPSFYLKEFKRLLAQGGRLMVSLPTENLLYRTGRFLAGFHRKEDYHVSELEGIVKQAVDTGFRAESDSSVPGRLLQLYKVFVFVGTEC